MALTKPQQICYLSKTKVAQPRDGDENTITIWDEKVLEKHVWRAFGIEGRENLENLYFGILSMARSYYKSIEKMSKYPPKALNNLITSLKNEDIACLQTKYIVPNDKETPYTMGKLELRLNLVDKFPRLGLFLKEEEEQGGAYITGLYLFPNEVAKLIKWMNGFYEIGTTQLKCYEITKKFDFF